MSDEEILEIDFYDFFGSGNVFTTDKERIEWYRKFILNEEE